MSGKCSLYLVLALFALTAAVFGCKTQTTTTATASPNSANNPVGKMSDPAGINLVANIREKLRGPLSPKEQEALVKPKSFSSIGQLCKIEGLEALPCVGYGLVTGLGDKGAQKSDVPKTIKDDVIKSLVREEGRTVLESKAMVESRDSSIVGVTGLIPAGAGPQTVFDVKVEPRDSAISLEGGFLHASSMRTFIVSDRKTVAGDIVAQARGPVMVGATGTGVMTAEGSGRLGVIFDGGLFTGERDFIIRLDPKRISGAHTVLMEYLLNKRFRDVGKEPGSPGVNYAMAISDRDTMMRIPPLYRRYPKRLADVIATIKGSYFFGPPSESEIRKTAEKLSTGTPEEKYQASVVLEGIGEPTTPFLVAALSTGDDWTKLYAGTTLAYLNDPRAAEVIVAAAGSQLEDVRFEAVRLMAQMSGRTVVQTLRDKLADPSKRIAIEAVKGLIKQGPDVAQVMRVSYFDVVKISGGEPALLVISSGRPMVVIVGPPVSLKSSVNIPGEAISIASISDREVGIVTGVGAGSQTVNVDATGDSVAVAVARLNPDFSVMRKILVTMEDNGNLPYRIAWLE